jgi:hypothetical protein
MPLRRRFDQLDDAIQRWLASAMCTPSRAAFLTGRPPQVMHAPTIATPVGQPPMCFDAKGHLDDLDLLERAGSRGGLFQAPAAIKKKQIFDLATCRAAIFPRFVPGFYADDSSARENRPACRCPVHLPFGQNGVPCSLFPRE